MIEIPRIAPRHHAEIIGDATVVVVSESDHAVLTGPLVVAVVARINGRRKSTEISAELADRALPEDVFYVIDGLARRGVLQDAAARAPEAAEVWAGLPINYEYAVKLLATTPVAVAGLGDAQTGPLEAALESLGVRICPSAALTVAVAGSYLDTALRPLSRAALRTERPWVLARSGGPEVWVGPVFVPGQTGCWSCLERRLRTTQVGHVFAPQDNTASRWDAAGPALGSVDERRDSCRLQALQIAYWIAAPHRSLLAGRILTFDALTWRSESHVVVRLPDCEDCGRPAEPRQTIPPVHLRPRPKQFLGGGGARRRSPDETIAAYAHHVSRVSGAVRQLAPCPEVIGSGAHVYLGSFHPARPLQVNDLVGPALGRGCAGKGATDAEAKASALGEALERFSAQFQGNEPRWIARLADLGDRAIHPNACMGFSAQQYARRASAKQNRSRFHKVPDPFDEMAEFAWSPVWSLTRREVRYLPTAYCYLAYPEPDETRYIMGDTNGNAAGSSPEDAVIQGFFELVERDAVGLWWYNRTCRPALDLDGFNEPLLAAARTFLQAHRRECWALDLTTDLGIPVFAFLSRAITGAEAVHMGFGASFDPRVALHRAVTEHMQTLALLLQVPGDNGDRPGTLRDTDVSRWLREATLAVHPYLAPDGSAPPRRSDDFTFTPTDDLLEDILHAQAIIEGLGMELLVLDMTRPEIGLPVLKVIVPGLRHLRPRFAPGRLFDVPVKLGWRDHPIAEDDLNPVALFL